MKSDMEIVFDDPADLGSLRDFLSGHPAFTVTTSKIPIKPGELSGGREILEFVFGGGGSAAAFTLIKTWIESKVTVIRIKKGEDEIEIRSLHAAEDLEKAKDALFAKSDDDSES